MDYKAPYGSSDPNAPYVDRNTPGATSGSKVPGSAVEATQRELVALISAAGLTPSGSDLQQVLKAIRSGYLNLTTVAGGTQNALTAALSVPATAFALLSAVPLLLRTGALPNTAAATINIDGLGVKSIVRADASPLKAGDLPASSFLRLLYDGTSFRALDIGGASVPPSSVASFLTPGVTNWTVPAGITRIRPRVWAGGGGGGGSNSFNWGGSGGGGGEYREDYFSVSAGSILAVTVGAGGAAGVVGTTIPGNGGSSSVGSLITALGGGGGTNAAASDPATYGAGGTGGGGSGIKLPGGRGGNAVAISAGQRLGGIGGAAFGTSQALPPQGSFGPDGNFPGGGASGASANQPGGTGANGYVLIEY